jgi:hypothetical protein
MANNSFTRLNPKIRSVLVEYGNNTPLCGPSTCGVNVANTAPLPENLVNTLLPILGPSGVGHNRHKSGCVPCGLHHSAFLAQYAFAYQTLARLPHGQEARNDVHSYALKHAVENAWGRLCVYISNGAVILAALAHDYPVARFGPPDTINVSIRLNNHWREAIYSNVARFVALPGTAL